ncbi:MAG: CoA-binding protein [Candidatus Kapaibacterium sp.]|jgi:predicted CoA-binding protein|nr:CoA-binding protein [Candidatus Kapabacteria bacterium]
MNFEEIFSKYENIAVYGMSKQPVKPAHSVPAFMKKQGYNIIPINPTADRILGLTSHSRLMDVPDEIHILNIFRPSQDIPKILEEVAVRKKERGDISLIWLQEGITCEIGKEFADTLGIDYIENRCMYKDYVVLGTHER